MEIKISDVRIRISFCLAEIFLAKLKILSSAPLVDSDYLQVVPGRRMMAMVEDGHAAPAHMSTITEEDGPRFTRGNVIRYCKR